MYAVEKPIKLVNSPEAWQTPSELFKVNLQDAEQTVVKFKGQ